MARSRSRLRSELSNTVERTALLNKIKALLASSARHVVLAKGAFRSNASGLAQVVVDPAQGSPIQFQRLPFASVAASLHLQDLTYLADAAGAAGNSITVAYTTGATAGSEVVTVVGNAISVQISTGVSTATQVKTAVDASVAASALISVAIDSGQGAHAQTAPVAVTNLAGGVTAATLESYAASDIQIIKRLRTKKWLVKINSSAVSS